MEIGSPHCGPCKNAGMHARGPLCIETEYGSLVCPRCGAEDMTPMLNPRIQSGYTVPLINNTSYTRLKRFKKYLNRSTMAQSKNSVPRETWKYLLAGMPYRNPAAIVRRLKKAPKSVRKKCYDSLPLLVSSLCNCRVPTLSEIEKARALCAFRQLDAAYGKGEPFVSYLYALEFILQHIGRPDMLPFINKISCRKRRAAYRRRLRRVFEYQ